MNSSEVDQDYICPESEKSSKSDIYSLGMVLYRLISKSLPTQQDLKPLETTLSPTILKMLNIKPSLRPSCSDIIETLKNLSGHVSSSKDIFSEIS